MQNVELEDVQRIPTWFVKLVTGAIFVGMPWAVFVTYNTLANQFAVNDMSIEVSGIKADMASLENASIALTNQTIELRSDMKYLANAMNRFDEGTDERAEIKAAVSRMERDIAALHSAVRNGGVAK